MKLVAIMLLSLLSIAAQAETLSFPQSGLALELEWTSGPVLRTESTLRMQWRDPLTGAAKAPPAFEVSIRMPSMNHGARPPVVQPTEAVGTFHVSKIFFSMGGEWELRVRVRQADGSFEQSAFLLNIPGGHRH